MSILTAFWLQCVGGLVFSSTLVFLSPHQSVGSPIKWVIVSTKAFSSESPSLNPHPVQGLPCQLLKDLSLSWLVMSKPELTIFPSPQNLPPFHVHMSLFHNPRLSEISTSDSCSFTLTCHWVLPIRPSICLSVSLHSHCPCSILSFNWIIVKASVMKPNVCAVHQIHKLKP